MTLRAKAAESDFDACARSLSGLNADGEFKQDWYVYWWRKDGSAHGSRGAGLSLASATRLASDIKSGRMKP